MKDYQQFQVFLRTTGSYTTPPADRRSTPARVSAINSFLYAFTIIRIVARCAWNHLLGRFDYDKWSEICSASIRFAERLGATVTFEGFEQRGSYDGPVVYVSNHMSTLETMVYPTALNAFGKLAIILKQSLEDIPLVGAASRAVGSIAVTRKNARADLVTVLEQGAKRLADNSSVLLFPQGTRQSVFEAKRFNTLGAKLAERAKVPLVPLAVRTDFLKTGKLIKDFGIVDPKKPILFACGPMLMPELGAKKMHEQSVAFIENKIKDWGLPVAAAPEP
ncbi:MAG: lysophospholipid acyltransferase family protein [Kiritimatiellae bacterium]|nr:lysophospholipid acyltransferase family protein [Kiritimatiellia bacterium]